MNSIWSYSPEAPNLGQNRWFFVPCDLEIWRMTLKNNRAPLLTYFKLCASFRSHWWIHARVRVQKRPISVKIGDFLSPVALKLDRWPWKTIGQLFYATSSYVHHFLAISEFKLELWSEKRPNWGKISFWPLWPWPLTMTFRMDITSAYGNNSWIFQDETMTGTLSKWCDGRTDRWECS